jgi:hypothetical protein
MPRQGLRRGYWRENFRRLLHDWDQRETLIGLVVLVVTALGYGVIAQNPTVVKWSTFAVLVYVVLLLFVITPKQMWDEAQAAIVAYEDRLKPNLSFVFEPDRAPFLQTFLLSAEQPDRLVRIVRLYRVGVRNESAVAIDRVRVVIESATYFRGGQAVPRSPKQPVILEHALNIMGRDKKSGLVSVAPGDRPTAYFDVVEQISPANGPTSRFISPCYATGHRTALAADKWVFCLRVEGGGAYSRVNAVVTASEQEREITMRLSPA